MTSGERKALIEHHPRLIILCGALYAAGYDEHQVAEKLGLSLRTVQTWRRRGKKERLGCYHEYYRALTVGVESCRLERMREIVERGSDDGE